MGWSVNDLDDPEIYSLWAGGRYEVHDGVLVELPPWPFYRGAAIHNLSVFLVPYLEERKLRPLFAPASDIQINPIRIVRASAVAVWGDGRLKFDALAFPPHEHWSDYALTIPPTMIIESISVGHENHDRRTKRRWYADFGVRHYWIVDGLRRTLDCLLLDGGQYRDDGSGREADVVRPPSLEALAIPLADVWVR